MTTLFRKRIFIALLCLVPLFVFVLSHYSMNVQMTGTHPTGFFNGEAPYYMSNARQYLDHGFGSIFYGNPFSYLENGEKVYFQFQTYLLALALKLTPIPPGVLWVLFGMLFSVLFITRFLSLVDKLGGKSTSLLLFTILFVWGGGIQAALGFFVSFLENFDLVEGVKGIERFEVAEGWWMQSIGRNFLMPNYTFYHFLVMSGLCFIVDLKNKSLLVLLFILSFSHPFVGAQFIGSVLLWLVIERFYLKSREVSYFSIQWVFVILIMHIAYYFGFLSTSTEHVAQAKQWDVSYESLYQNWAMQAKNFIPSYLIAFSLFFYQIRTTSLFTKFFRSFFNRFLLVFGCTNFLLANHEFAIKPIQPIHFTHGMVWFPFFLLGRQTVFDLIDYMKRSTALKKVCIVGFFILIISDNLAWMAKRTYQTHIGKSQSEIKYTNSQKEVVDFIQGNIQGSQLFFVADVYLGYHLTVYTPARIFASHNIITPYSNKRRLIQKEVVRTGEVPEEYQEDEIYIITNAPFSKSTFGETLFENEKYRLIKI